MDRITHQIADELAVRSQQVAAAVALLDEGATVPFIARYRKEVTGSLDDTQLRQLEQRLSYLREMEERRATILRSIEEQGKLTEPLREQINLAETKARLEDLYLPYKPKRRTKGQIAIEAGLEPLADLLFQDPTRMPEQEAESYLNADAGFGDTKAVLEGARNILSERFAEHADVIAALRSRLRDQGVLRSRVAEGKEQEGAKYRDYFAHDEPLIKVPSHRALAMFRGRNEGVLYLAVELPDVEERNPHPCEGMIAAQLGIEDRGRAADRWLQEVVRWTWRVKLSLNVVSDLLQELRERAEDEAIGVFASNLRDLLLAAPAGRRATLGLDPGLRTGVKMVVVDGTGKLVEQATIYPHVPKNQWDQSIATLADIAARHQVELVAIGNGTASRETEKLVVDLASRHPELKLTKVLVSEAGASVYSASDLAAREFPDVDVSLRGAVSIARRLQDPLAELVKIEPKSIGVGQYQHDLNQLRLAGSLDAVVEDCVNSVGVELNTASGALLRRVAGLSESVADAIVSYRDSHGPFGSREALLSVPRLGAKTFEQCAGFLRIQGGDNPLDASGVHPESYPLVERIAAHLGSPVAELMGNAAALKSVRAANFVEGETGEVTITDILRELEKPGRDPRPEFQTATFRDGIEKISDLEIGMVLEGTVSNVANFGAFVDIGVHQDGLVHISALSHQFVKDPRSVVKTGDVVKVKVMEVDQARKRISLTMRLDDEPGQPAQQPDGRAQHHRQQRSESRSSRPRQHKAEPSRNPSKPSGAKPGTLGELLLAAQQRK